MPWVSQKHGREGTKRYSGEGNVEIMGPSWSLKDRLKFQRQRGEKNCFSEGRVVRAQKQWISIVSL